MKSEVGPAATAAEPADVAAEVEVTVGVALGPVRSRKDGASGVLAKKDVPVVTIWAAITTGCGIGSGEGAVGEDGLGEAVTRAGFAVRCCAKDCGFEERSPRSAAGAMTVSKVVGDAVGGIVSDVLDDLAGEVSGPVSNAVSKDVVGVSTDVDNRGVVTGLAAESFTDLASDLPANFEVRFNELRFGLVLPPRLGAVLGRNLDSMFVSDFETNSAPIFSSALAPSFAPDLASVFAAV